MNWVDVKRALRGLAPSRHFAATICGIGKGQICDNTVAFAGLAITELFATGDIYAEILPISGP